MAHLINPPFPFPFPSSHYYPHPLMATLPSKPLNPDADPFPSTASFPPPPPHFLFYPRPVVMPYFWPVHASPVVSCYDAWSLMTWTPPRQAADVGGGGGAVADSKPVLRRNCSRFTRQFVVSCGPRTYARSSLNWVEKKTGGDAVYGGACGDVSVEKSGLSSVDGGLGNGVTTVMIKNIPNQFKRRDLLQLLDRYCQLINKQRSCRANFYDTEYDFVYLPMDFRRSWYEGKVSNLGYAFVNFTTSAAASQFCAIYHNYKWDVSVNKKICEISQARIQGMEALKNAFKNKIFWCRTDQCLPVMLSPPSNGHRRYQRVIVGRRIPCVPRKPIKKCLAAGV